MGFKNTSSLTIIVAAILLAVFYIRPALTTVGELQDKIFVFKDNADKATEVNARLQELQNEIANLRQSDVIALETYLPTDADMLQVMYDVESIAQSSGLTVTEITAVETEETSTAQSTDFTNLDISVEERAMLESLQTVDNADVAVMLTGRYANFKQFLEQITVNQYPLDIIRLQFGADEGTAAGEINVSELNYSLVLRTYAFNYLRNR